jgi:hypothetical protein
MHRSPIKYRIAGIAKIARSDDADYGDHRRIAARHSATSTNAIAGHW